MSPYYSFIAEFLGTTFLVFMGEGALAAHLLEGSLFKGAGVVFICIAWGLGIAFPTSYFFRFSGAYFNPAVTLGFALTGSFPWKSVPLYLTAEMLGGFLGACLVFIFYYDQFQITKNPRATLGVFVTGPRKINYFSDTFAEIIGTMFLVIFNMTVPGIFTNNGWNGLYAGLIITSLSFSFGGINGLAMNPARDLSPRIAHAILPIKYKGPSDWNYALVPVIGPIIGATIGALVGTGILNMLYPNLA